MARTVVYRRDCVPAEPAGERDAAELLQPKSAGTPRKTKPPAEAPATTPAPAGRQPDGYGEKLLKYIPAEVVAFYAPLAAAVDLGAGAAWALLGVGLAGTIVHALVRARREGLHPPPLHFVLAGLAFVAWACGAGDVLTAAFGVAPVWNKIVLGAGVFLVPALDELLDELWAT